MFIGRLGCHNYGCCVGKVSQRRFGIVYSDPEAKICREVPQFQGIKLIPVQLIAAGIDLLLFFLCWFVIHFYSFSGVITIIFLFGVNLKRIVLQPYRWKDSSNKISYQWVSVTLILTRLFCVLFYYSSGELIFKEENLKVPLIPSNYFSFILTDHHILLPLLAGATINFIAYGIHGKKLGTHFNRKT
jgi:prolipoprotein diacylglyceryltransferase